MTLGPPAPVPVEAGGWGAKTFWLQGKGGRLQAAPIHTSPTHKHGDDEHAQCYQ